MPKSQALVPTVIRAAKGVTRDKNGRVLKGSVLNPEGSTYIDQGLHAKIAVLSRTILEQAGDDGKTTFEKVARYLLDPVIGQRLDKDGNPVGESYLVNGQTMLNTLEFLAKRGYGREVGPPDEGDKKGLAGMIVILHAPRPDHAARLLAFKDGKAAKTAKATK